MSVNLLDLAANAIGDPTLKQLSNILGSDEGETQAGISAALPVILGVLMKKSSTPDGAAEVFRQVEEQDDSILDDLNGLLGGAGRAGLLSGGLTLAKHLFGSDFDKLGGLLGKSSGLAADSISKLLSFLVPVVFSLLSRQQSSLGLDAAGIAGLLADQKANLAGLLPRRLCGELDLGDAMASAGSAEREVGQSVADTTRRAGDAAARTTNVASQSAGQMAGALGNVTHDVTQIGSSAMGRLFPIIGLLALALLGWMFLKSGTRNVEPVSTTGDEGVVIEGIEDISLGPPVVNNTPDGATESVDAVGDTTETSQITPPP